MLLVGKNEPVLIFTDVMEGIRTAEQIPLCSTGLRPLRFPPGPLPVKRENEIGRRRGEGKENLYANSK